MGDLFTATAICLSSDTYYSNVFVGCMSPATRLAKSAPTGPVEVMSQPCKSAVTRFFESKHKENELANPDASFMENLRSIQIEFSQLSKEERCKWGVYEDETKLEHSKGEFVWWLALSLEFSSLTHSSIVVFLYQLQALSLNQIESLNQNLRLNQLSKTLANRLHSLSLFIKVTTCLMKKRMHVLIWQPSFLFSMQNFLRAEYLDFNFTTDFGTFVFFPPF